MLSLERSGATRAPSPVNSPATNTCTGIGYRAEFAEFHAVHRKAKANQRYAIAAGSPLERHIMDKLRCRWSPDEIRDDLAHQEKRRTCTNDSGPEFAEHGTMEAELRITMYFAHPYHSWERGTSENTNRLLRQFFPKGTNFAEIEQWELAWAVDLINHRPRKRLNYRTPHEVFWESGSVALRTRI